MFKVQVLIPCSDCKGEAYIPMGEVEDSQGHKYIHHIPCPYFEGSGNESKWILLEDLASLMRHAICLHKRTSLRGKNTQGWECGGCY